MNNLNRITIHQGQDKSAINWLKRLALPSAPSACLSSRQVCFARLRPLVLALLMLPFAAHAVDELGLFELDENFADDDSVTTDSCGWDLDGNTTIDTDEECPREWVVPDGIPTFDLRDGLVDIDKNGVADFNDDGIITVGVVNFDVIDGFIDYDSDNKIDDVEAGAHDTCYYLGVAPGDHDPGPCFGGRDILFGYVDYNDDGAAPSIDGGNDGENLLIGTADAFQYFFGVDDTSTRLTTDLSICNTGIADVSGSDCTIYQGGASFAG